MKEKTLFAALWLLAHATLATDYYVDISIGNNGNNGQSLSAPWATIEYAIQQLSAGDDLFIRQGTYHESEILVSSAGNEDAWITIQPWNKEQVTISGSLPGFSHPDNDLWEVHDADRRIYRTRGTYDLEQVHGYLGDDNGHWKLVTYETLDTLSADTETYRSSYPYYYVGPGIHYHQGQQKIYVRLQHSIYQNQMGLKLPAVQNPNRIGLHLFDDNQVLVFTEDAHYLRFQGINLMYQNYALEFKRGARHIDFFDAKLIGGRYTVLIRDGAHHIRLARNRYPGYMPPWIARSDVKRPRNGRPAHLMQGSAINIEESAHDIEITHSHFDYHFDAIDATGNPGNLKVNGNRFHRIRDDVLQLGSAAWNVEVAHNFMTAVATGVSWNGSGAASSDNAGRIYIHHNIIDASEFQLYGRLDPNGELEDKFDGPNGDGMGTGRAFGMHSRSSISGPAPWKIYNNTLIVSRDIDGRGTGAAYFIEHFDPDNPHEVFNNIFIQKWDHYLIRAARTDDGSQIFDGNLYHRSSATHKTNQLYQIYDIVDGTYSHFRSLPDFMNSASQTATRLHYPPGWEANGVAADPKLDGMYRPGVNSPALTGAVDLSRRGWPGADGRSYRGALPAQETNLIFSDSFESP